MANLAYYFNVSIRTICYDITILTASHPIETVKGKGGCVRLMYGTGIFQNILSEEHQNFLLRIAISLDLDDKTLMHSLLQAYGSKRNMERISAVIL